MQGKRIMIINQYAENKGDRAVLYSLVTLISKFNPESIAISTSDPGLWSVGDFETGVPLSFVPWGWDYSRNIRKNILIKGWYSTLNHFKPYTYSLLRELFLLGVKQSFIYRFFANPAFQSQLKKTDIVISTGGHHITTLLSRDVISSQTFDMAIVLGVKKPLVLWSQSIGPLDFVNDRNRRFITSILQNTWKIFIRDEQSRLVIEQLHLSRSLDFTYETVIYLNSLINNFVSPGQRKNVIGISIYSTKKRDFEETADYINSIVGITEHLIRKNYRVLFIPMELKGSEPDDRKLLHQIISRLTSVSNVELLENDLSSIDHLKKVMECRCFIGHKTHSIIFALTTGTPLIAIAYHEKSKDFMAQYGVSEFCIDDEDLNAGILVERFERLNEKLDITGSNLFNRSREFSKGIESSMQRLLS